MEGSDVKQQSDGRGGHWGNRSKGTTADKLGWCLGLIHEDCKGLAGIGEGKREKQIILILTHGHREVAVFVICVALPKYGQPSRLLYSLSLDEASCRINPESNMPPCDA